MDWSPPIVLVFAFVAMTLLDFVWARYTIATAARRAVPASSWSAGIALVNGVVVLALVQHWWVLFATIPGAFIGTMLAVKYQGDT